MTPYRAWLESIFVDAMALAARLTNEPHREAEWTVAKDDSISPESSVEVAALLGRIRIEWSREPGSRTTVREMSGYFSRRGAR